MSVFVKASLGWAGLYGAGDFLAQFYGAHLEAAKRRAKGEKSPGRPSAQQMYGMLDKEQLAQSAVFGAVCGPLVTGFRRQLPSVFGPLRDNLTACICALGLQQLLVSPAILLAYFGSMTAVRGGFESPDFMSHLPGRHGPYAVVSYVASDVLPTPLLLSWALFVPESILAYMGFPRGSALITGFLFLCWTAATCHAQKTLLL